MVRTRNCSRGGTANGGVAVAVLVDQVPRHPRRPQPTDMTWAKRLVQDLMRPLGDVARRGLATSRASVAITHRRSLCRSATLPTDRRRSRVSSSLVLGFSPVDEERLESHDGLRNGGPGRLVH